jgi:hypothetical protein
MSQKTRGQLTRQEVPAVVTRDQQQHQRLHLEGCGAALTRSYGAPSPKMGEGREFASANCRGEGPVRAVVLGFSRDVSGFVVSGELTHHFELRDGQVQLVIGGFDDRVQSDLAWNSRLVKNCGDPSARFQGFAHSGEQAVHARVRDGCAFAHGNDLGFSSVDFELGHAETWGAKTGALERERVFAHPFRQPARFVFGEADPCQVLGFC